MTSHAGERGGGGGGGGGGKSLEMRRGGGRKPAHSREAILRMALVRLLATVLLGWGSGGGEEHPPLPLAL